MRWRIGVVVIGLIIFLLSLMYIVTVDVRNEMIAIEESLMYRKYQLQLELDILMIESKIDSLKYSRIELDTLVSNRIEIGNE